MATELENEMQVAIERIWQICHTPSKGKHAYTHFMADFDEIRAICKKWISRPLRAQIGN